MQWIPAFSAGFAMCEGQDVAGALKLVEEVVIQGRELNQFVIVLHGI